MLTEANATTESIIDPALHDGYEVHRAALARGMNVTLLPRQVMTVETPAGVQHTFIHGIPETSTLSGVTYAQDKRIRRALMERSGFTVPRGATFSVGHSPSAAHSFADRIGYPVVVKPAIGDNTTEVIAGIHDAHQLGEAIEYLRTPPQERPNYTRAAYALTELREPGKRSGRVMVPPGYRFLVEQHISGEYLRVFVLYGQIRSVLLCPDGPWDSTGTDLQNVFDDVHRSILQIALEASKTIPGLPLVTIDIIVPNHRADTSSESVVVVEYSERPWLATQARLDPTLSSTLANDILTASVGATGSPRDSVTIAATLDGAVDSNLLLQALVVHCRSVSLVGSAAISDLATGSISAKIQGAPGTIAELMERLLAGDISPQRPMFIQQHHAERITNTEFAGG